MVVQQGGGCTALLYEHGVEYLRWRAVSRLNGKLFESWKRDRYHTTRWRLTSSLATRDETARPWSLSQACWSFV